MRVINVIEVVDNNVIGVESFGVFMETRVQEVVDKAEDCFINKAMENGCALDTKELHDVTENGSWESGDYTVNIVWSEINP